MIHPGDLVEHINFGQGLVVETRHSGYEARVDFTGYPLWLPAAKLSLLERAAGVVKHGRVKAKSLLSVPDSVNFQSRHVIESLRLGVVPDFGIVEWTVGREEEFAQVQSWLDDESEGSLLIEGKYGSGKTHMLRHLAQTALEGGRGVSLIRVDPGEENSSFPYRFLVSVMRNLQIPYNGGISDIRTVFRERILATKKSCIDDHVFLGPFASAIRAGKDSDADWQGFMGERGGSSLFPSSYDFTTVANIVCNLLSAISRFLVEEVDVGGFLLLVDEAETAEVRRYPYHWKRTLNFFRGLALAANDDPSLEEKAERSATGVQVGKMTGLVYSGHYPGIRYYHEIPTFLKVVLALTDCRVKGKLEGWKENQPLVRLSDIRRTDLKRLFSRAAGTYCALHGITFPKHLERWVLNDVLYDAFAAASIRGFMKALIEVLDFLRHNPGKPLEALDSLREF
jgi:hypothetical protein